MSSFPKVDKETARIIFYELRIGYIKDQGHIGDLRAGRRNA